MYLKICTHRCRIVYKFIIQLKKFCKVYITKKKRLGLFKIKNCCIEFIKFI